MQGGGGGSGLEREFLSSPKLKTNPSRNKLILCFRPVDNDADADDRSCISSPAGAGMEDDGHGISSPLSYKISSPSPLRSFPATLKSALLDSPLRRSFQERKNRKRQERSYSCEVPDHCSKHKRKKPLQLQKSKSDISTFFIRVRLGLLRARETYKSSQPPGSAGDSVTSREGRSNGGGGSPSRYRSACCSADDAQASVEGRGLGTAVAGVGTNSCFGLVYLVLFCLWVTVFWGRLNAVMMTTTWLYAAQLMWQPPCRRFWRSDTTGTHDQNDDLAGGK